METAFVRRRQDTELFAREEDTSATRDANCAPDLAVVPRGQAVTGRRHRREHSVTNGDSAMTLYLREAGQVRRLPPQAELEARSVSLVNLDR